jgi:hypothetical protein
LKTPKQPAVFFVDTGCNTSLASFDIRSFISNLPPLNPNVFVADGRPAWDGSAAETEKSSGKIVHFLLSVVEFWVDTGGLVEVTDCLGAVVEGV